LLPGVDCWYGEADAAFVLEYSEMKFMTVWGDSDSYARVRKGAACRGDSLG
jgi:hypothetical protein